MATATNRQPREVIDFPPNTPVTVALKFAAPKLISNQYGERAMYSTADGRIFFLNLAQAKQVEELAPQAGETFVITKRSSGRKDDPPVWEIARPMGQQADGTFVVPKLPEPKPMARAASLVDEANALVDAYASVLERALSTYGGRVKPEEVRSIVLSAYIQRRSHAA